MKCEGAQEGEQEGEWSEVSMGKGMECARGGERRGVGGGGESRVSKFSEVALQ